MLCLAERGYVTGREPKSIGRDGTVDASEWNGMGTMAGEEKPFADAALLLLAGAGEVAVAEAVAGGDTAVDGVGAGMWSGWIGTWRRAATGPFC